MPPTSTKPAQSRKEEMANGVSHGLALLLSMLATPFLIIQAVHKGGVGFVVGVSVFCTSMILLYLSSTIYHLLNHGKAKGVFQVLDHGAIYLLIAGTYTPFALGVFEGALGWALFGVIWGLAAVGIALKTMHGTRWPLLSVALYLFMGWLILFAIKPLVTLVPTSVIYWLVAGGVSYTAGVVFYALDSRFRFSHFIWHLFVMAGTACHYAAVYSYEA